MTPKNWLKDKVAPSSTAQRVHRPFPYVEYETTNELGMRWYSTPIGALPSITTVLGITEAPEKKRSLEQWRKSLGEKSAAQKSLEATQHGTMVHTLVERYLKDQEVFAPVDGQSIPQDDRNAFNSLKLKLNLINEIWGQEKALYSDQVQVAGRFDCAGEYKGVPSIIDFKTAARIKNRDDVADYEIQLAFYAMAHNERFGTDIKQGVILMAAAKGFPLEFIVDVESKFSELRERAARFWAQVLQKV
jgi:genome maintenance exonuclease 1